MSVVKKQICRWRGGHILAGPTANAAGAHSKIRALGLVAKTAAAAATMVTVLPVPGGPSRQYGGPAAAAGCPMLRALQPFPFKLNQNSYKWFKVSSQEYYEARQTT
jgi:hypothetical protein